MAITATAVDTVGYRRLWSVIADADGAGTQTIAHGFTCIGVDNAAKDAYAKKYILPILSKVSAPGGLSNWYATIDRTNVTIGKANVVGSGDAGIQLYVTAWFVHSIVE